MYSICPQLRSKAGQRAAVKVAAATSMIAMPTAVVMLDDAAHPLHMQWTHTGYFTSYDCGALRRGFQVYRQVCATCHSVTGIRWRELVGVTHDEEALKVMAKECDYVDGPNGDGEMFERPGKMTDRLPAPYENIEQGRAANGGALPPDLTLMVKARHSGLDYLFSLLTGYDEPPAGKEVMPGLYYNPYFPGGAIAMPPPLSDGGVEYEDGTISTISQQAYDICQFLNWYVVGLCIICDAGSVSYAWF